MQLNRKVVWPVVGLCFSGLAYGQQSKEAIQVKIKEIQDKRKELVEVMNQANQNKDQNAYNEALAEYNKLGSDMNVLEAEYLEHGNKESQAKSAFNKGNQALKMGQMEAAVEAFDQPLALSPDNAKAYFGKGIALKKLNRIDEAKA